MNKSGDCLALIPHKDTLLILSQLQKQIIATANNGSSLFVPLFPLWAFITNDHPSFTNCSSCTINPPQADDHDLFFPVTLSHDGNTMVLRINFATTDDVIKKTPDFSAIEKSGAVPLTMRIFRLAAVTISNNGWTISKERWVKTK